MKYFYKLYYLILFKINDPKKVVNHPKYDLHIKYGFTVGSKHYYRLSQDYNIFENRFRYLKTFYQEVENKVTSQDIGEFMDAIVNYINDNKSVEAGELAKELKYRAEWLFEPTSLFKFASVMYFDLNENIKDYDVDYNHEKIRYWSKKKTLLRTLLEGLMTNVDSLLSLSKKDFEVYLSDLQKRKDKQQKLILESEPTKANKSKEVTI